MAQKQYIRYIMWFSLFEMLLRNINTLSAHADSCDFKFQNDRHQNTNFIKYSYCMYCESLV